MEKDLGKIKKNEQTDIIIRLDDFGGKVGLTIREFTTSERYTGFTKSGTRIPLESLEDFKQIVNSIDEKEAKTMQDSIQPEEKPAEKPEETSSENQSAEKPVEERSTETSSEETNPENNSDSEIKEEVF